MTAFALGATGSLALSGTGTAASTTPLGVTAPSPDPCAGRPSCVVGRLLRLVAAAASPPAAAAAVRAPGDADGTPDERGGDAGTASSPAAPAAPADVDGTADQGRGDV